MFSFYLNHQCFPSAIQSQVKLLGFINLFASDTHLLLSVFLSSVNPEIEFISHPCLFCCSVTSYGINMKTRTIQWHFSSHMITTQIHIQLRFCFGSTQKTWFSYKKKNKKNMVIGCVLLKIITNSNLHLQQTVAVTVTVTWIQSDLLNREKGGKTKTILSLHVKLAWGRTDIYSICTQYVGLHYVHLYWNTEEEPDNLTDIKVYFSLSSANTQGTTQTVSYCFILHSPHRAFRHLCNLKNRPMKMFILLF